MTYRAILYALFFLSGLSALIYQILWVRSFSLIFGGSHMAVTTVLAVFMGGLALGGYLGRHTDRSPRPLRIYGLLEIGIGVAAILLIGLLSVYPDLYIAFAHLVNNNLAVLTFVRTLFAIIALLVPTTLMGLTLPALAGFANRQMGGHLGEQLSFLYGINTFGAVAGALAAGFFLLRYFTVTSTYGLAIAISLLVGVLALALDRRSEQDASAEKGTETTIEIQESVSDHVSEGGVVVPVRLILIGIGVSGFCALGYEILWTRVLSIVVGTTVYSYTLMLVAFLIGIALGGGSYQLLLRLIGKKSHVIGRMVLWFGLTQIVIGLLAILVSIALRDLTGQALIVEEILRDWYSSGNKILQTTNFVMALLYMLVPAFFMGLAFPLAGDIVARARGKVGKAVGETLTWNTVGAILGAAVSGFVLIYLFGIERSLQYLSLINLGFGLMICVSLFKNRIAMWGVATSVVLIMVVMAANPEVLRIWDTKYFATFNHNARQAFTTEEKRAEIDEITEVMYYAEGTTSTVSVVKIKGVNQGLNVNGRTVASNDKKDQQCQYTLGHLPMLLHKNPEKVWVLGMGTGMTAGATVVHPEVKSVTVVELEKHVVPAARTFAADNHSFLEHPKVKVVFNDGRNFLLTTEERYDVITADPIHPWSQGAAYLYTDEYYRLAASRLRSGGVMCQWLPIYELTPRDLRSVVKTFANNFQYVYVWLTDYDAELIGSNEPIEINIDDLQKRIEASPEVLADLQRVDMGSAAQFLSYGIMGPAASRAYGKEAPLNTDDNLFLEFSAPDSKGKAELIAINIASLASYREDLSPYISGETLYAKLGTDSSNFLRATQIYDIAHQRRYEGKELHPGYALLMDSLERQFPWYAPGQFLRNAFQVSQSRSPQRLEEIKLTLVGNQGTPFMMTLTAVTIKISPERVKLLIVDNQAKKIYGHIYIDGSAAKIDQRVAKQAEKLLQLIDTVYRQEKPAGTSPAALPTLEKIKAAINSFKVEDI
ncbi:MAG: fused MFS/spermidine synthase [Desulfuromonadales bacterium]|nr:fused MFS/spermidine synthase [Desulfuromonadales bacterium]